MATCQYTKACDAYLRALFQNGRWRRVTFWVSIAVAYFKADQLRDCREALLWAARLDPNAHDVWYNLGVLVNRHYVSLSKFVLPADEKL